MSGLFIPQTNHQQVIWRCEVTKALLAFRRIGRKLEVDESEMALLVDMVGFEQMYDLASHALLA